MKLIGLGRLTADPEVQQTSGGTSFCRFSLADNEVRTSKQTGEKIETVHFFDFIIWDTAAETFAKYCKKGNQLYVECSARQDRWETDEGQKRSKVEFRVDNFRFVDGNRSKSNASSAPVEKADDQEVPF